MPQAEANVVSQNLLVSTSRKEISWCNRFGLRAGAWGPGPQGLGARAPAAWGPGPQGLGARAPERLGPRPKNCQFFVILKSLLAGGWRRGGSQLKRLPQMWGPGGKGERKRVFTLSVTETIQHAPQGRRTP